MSVTETSNDEVIEIRLNDVLAFLKSSRWFMLAGGLIGAVLGALLGLSKPNEYTSQITVLPEIASRGGSSLGNLGNLAGLAGIDVSGIRGSNDAISPDLYPNVLQSAPFALTLFKQPVYVSREKRTQTIEAYLRETNQPGFLGRLFSSGGSDNNEEDHIAGDTSRAIRLTPEQDILSKILTERVNGTYEKKTGVLTITSVMHDPVVAADAARHALTYLADYMTSYRTEKARREVDFLNRQVAAAKKRYQRAEYDLSAYRDRNRSLFLNTAKIEEQRIQAEFLLAQDLYNTLSKQAEMAKIKVQEETPVFKVLEPARIPIKKSGPKRSNYVVGFALLGVVIGLVGRFFKR